MNENLRKVIVALRSGNYKQTCQKLNRVVEHKGACECASCALANRVGMCCMGVAADVLDKDGWNAKPDLDGCKGHRLGYLKLNEAGLALLGLTDKDQQDFIRMNDNGRTFTEIADAMEKRFPD